MCRAQLVMPYGSSLILLSLQVVMPYGSGLINLIDPKAFEWTKQIITTQMLDTGVVGWMNDFGEAMPINAQLPAGFTMLLSLCSSLCVPL